MSINVTVIGVLNKDPSGKETHTMWKVKVFGSEVTLFSQESAAISRMNYSAGDRIRAEGRGGWNEFNEEYTLTVSGCAIDGSDAEEELKLKVDGTIPHELKVEFDDEDEGGGKYIPIEIEAPYRGKDANGDWGDLIAHVQAMVLGKAVEKLLKLDKEGITHLCFTGDLDTTPRYISGEPAYYMEVNDVAPSTKGGGNSDAHWKSKPIGLAKRKGAQVKAQPPKPARKQISQQTRTDTAGPDDEIPF